MSCALHASLKGSLGSLVFWVLVFFGIHLVAQQRTGQLHRPPTPMAQGVETTGLLVLSSPNYRPNQSKAN